MIFQLVDHWTDGTQVAVVGLDLRFLLHDTFHPQMVLQGGNYMASIGRHGLVLQLGLRGIGQGGVGQSKAGRSSVVGSGFSVLAAITENKRKVCH